MKIAFHNVDFSSRTGPNTFCTRLAKRLCVNGHVLVTPGDPCDIDFANIMLVARPRGAVLHRLDGLWTRQGDAAANAPIRRTYATASHIVWQSEYDKSIVVRRWGLKAGNVLHNGCALNIDTNRDLLTKVRGLADVVFCSAAAWHPQKRLNANIAAMRAHAACAGVKCCLVVLGHCSERVAGPDVWYCGDMSEIDCKSVYSAADCMLHLAWRDHCPNAVIEAMCAGTPVVCASSGGTKEVVRSRGTVIDDVDDKTADPDVFDFDSPPEIKLTGALTFPRRESFDIADLTIESVAEKYESVMRKMLNER